MSVNAIDGPVLKMEGRSGCRLEVVNNGGVYYVRKFSKEASYNNRLLRQAAKQKYYFQAGMSPWFFTPEILVASPEDANVTWFEMPYVHGQKYSEFFERASIVDIKNLALKFIQYFDQAFARARVEEVNISAIQDKIGSLREALLTRKDVDAQPLAWALTFLEKMPASAIPIGTCHGDFTLSNMIFGDDRIYLVDFLDSFIESPIIDLVKLRQDTFFYWSLLIENGLPENRRGKVVQVFNYLDAQIVKSVQQNVFVQQWYGYLQVFNLLRILPYVQKREEIELVEKGIKSIYHQQK